MALVLNLIKYDPKEQAGGSDFNNNNYLFLNPELEYILPSGIHPLILTEVDDYYNTYNNIENIDKIKYDNIFNLEVFPIDFDAAWYFYRFREVMMTDEFQLWDETYTWFDPYTSTVHTNTNNKLFKSMLRSKQMGRLSMIHYLRVGKYLEYPYKVDPKFNYQFYGSIYKHSIPKYSQSRLYNEYLDKIYHYLDTASTMTLTNEELGALYPIGNQADLTTLMFLLALPPTNEFYATIVYVMTEHTIFDDTFISYGTNTFNFDINFNSPLISIHRPLEMKSIVVDPAIPTLTFNNEVEFQKNLIFNGVDNIFLNNISPQISGSNIYINTPTVYNGTILLDNITTVKSPLTINPSSPTVISGEDFALTNNLTTINNSEVVLFTTSAPITTNDIINTTLNTYDLTLEDSLTVSTDTTLTGPSFFSTDIRPESSTYIKNPIIQSQTTEGIGPVFKNIDFADINVSKTLSGTDFTKSFLKCDTAVIGDIVLTMPEFAVLNLVFDPALPDFSSFNLLFINESVNKISLIDSGTVKIMSKNIIDANTNVSYQVYKKTSEYILYPSEISNKLDFLTITNNMTSSDSSKLSNLLTTKDASNVQTMTTSDLHIPNDATVVSNLTVEGDTVLVNTKTLSLGTAITRIKHLNVLTVPHTVPVASYSSIFSLNFTEINTSRTLTNSEIRIGFIKKTDSGNYTYTLPNNMNDAMDPALENETSFEIYIINQNAVGTIQLVNSIGGNSILKGNSIIPPNSNYKFLVYKNSSGNYIFYKVSNLT